MYENKTVCVVVPCYNEEAQVGPVIETLPEFVDQIVVVDDKSEDGTVSVVRKYEAKNSRVTLIAHDVNKGVGGAISSGYKYARDHGFDVAVVMAGDGQMDPADLTNILDPVVHDGVDYSKGNRLFSGEAFDIIPKVRFFGNAVLSLLTKIASGYWHVADSQSGYTAIGKRALQLIDWDKMYPRYGQPNDLLVRLNVFDLRVRDVPIKPIYRPGQRSGLKPFNAIFTIGWLVFRLWLWRLFHKYVIRDFHPLVFFYLIGVVLLGIGVLFLTRTLWLVIETGHIPELNTLSALFAFALGMQAVVFAMWLDMDRNKDLR